MSLPVLTAVYPNGLRSVTLTHPLTGDAPHTLSVSLSYPSYAQGFGPWSDHRLWLLHMGQKAPGSEHWIVSNDPKTPLQFGVFCGEQIRSPSPELRENANNARRTLLSIYDGTDYTLYCNGQLVEKREGVVFNFTDSALRIGQAAKLDGIDFDGLVYEVKLWDRALDAPQTD